MAVKKAKPVVEDSDKRKKKQNYPVQRNVLPPEDFSKFDLLPETTGFAKLAGVSKALLYCSLPVEGKPGYMIYSSSDFSISYRTDKFLFEGRLPQFLFYLVQLFHRKVHPNMSQNDLLQAKTKEDYREIYKKVNKRLKVLFAAEAKLKAQSEKKE